MAGLGMRSVLALAALAMLGSAGPLAAQAAASPAAQTPPTREPMKTCPNGQVIPEKQLCQIISTSYGKQCPPNSIRATVPANVACIPKPTRQCPGKIVVPVASDCPDPNLPLVPLKPAAIRPSPRSNPANWVPEFAYPRDALRAGSEGTVGFTLSVGPDGIPTQCNITQSSGHDSLDWAACESLMMRAKFIPAKDENGEPVAGAYISRVRWAIPQNAGGPNTIGAANASPLDWSAGTAGIETRPSKRIVEVDAVVNADGTWSSCNVIAEFNEDGKPMPLDEGLDAALCSRAPKPLRNTNGEAVKSRFNLKIERVSTILPD